MESFTSPSYPSLRSLLLWCCIHVILFCGMELQQVHGCLESERDGLLRLKAQFNHPNGSSSLPSWDLAVHIDCCQWEKIFCDPLTNRVIGIFLNQTKPLPSLNQIPHPNISTWVRNWEKARWSLDASIFLPFEDLQFLNLGYNNLNGLEELPRLGKLESLDLSINWLTTMPSVHVLPSLKILNLQSSRLCQQDEHVGLEELSRLGKLESLDLSGNCFTYMPSVHLLPWLKILNLGSNRLSDWDELAAEVTELKELEVLNLRSNQFSGNAPAFIGDLTSLKSLSFGWAGWEGKINGSFPEALCRLKNLQELDLCKNQIQGYVPSCLAELTSLRVLDLHKNNLKGSVPAFLFASLNSLEYVSLSSNGFEGSFSFSSLANNPNLEVFELVDNDNILDVDTESPTGWIPLFQLKVLSLRNCNFNKPTGAIPSFLLTQNQLRLLNLDNTGLKGDFLNCLFGNNTSLERVSLSNNSLQGTIDLNPNSQNPHLLWLDVSCNHISGEIPLLVGSTMPNLAYLNMSGNALRGPIPHSIGLMRQLVSLDLSNNFLSGEVPASLAINCSKLAFLKLSNNSFQGIFPPQTSNLKDLRTLHLDNNNFTAFTEGVLNSAFLSLLDVSQNVLSGKIPDWIGNLKYLSTLVLSKNFLQGPVPTSLCSMSYLDLSHNHLGPAFPPCSSLPSLVHLHMQNNNLMGPIPNVLSQAPSLMTLDLSHNKLSGGIPDWFAASLPNLRIVLLKGNILDGPIPFSLCDLRNISILDFSYNRLSGVIPFCLSDMLLGRESLFDDGYDGGKYGWSNYGSLKTYSHTNQLSVNPTIQSDYYMRDENDLIHFVTKKRDESYEGHILYYMSGLDLSCNELEGPISPTIGLLSGIHALNLSHNYLTGSIPYSFSHLEQIESLNLSHNMLSGEIPTQLLALNFLSVFSVAYNNLSGMTPKMVRQFSTFDASSYQGNPRLHGPPLSNEESCCDMHYSNGGDEGDFGGSDQDYFWFSFAGSSVMLFFSVCGYFYLNSYHLDTILGFANAQLSKVPYCANFAKLLVRRNDSIRFVLDVPHKSGAPDLTVKSMCWYRFFTPSRSTRRIEPFPTASLQLT